MVIEKKKTLLATLTHISDSKEDRECEYSLLKRYMGLMRNRQSFFINQQKATQNDSSANFFDSFKKRGD